METSEYPKIIENETAIVLKYTHADDFFDLVYDKNKDKVILMKNGKLTDHQTLRDDESSRFKEFLDVAICYHHDRDGEYLH